jgi:hypothetical protein
MPEHDQRQLLSAAQRKAQYDALARFLAEKVFHPTITWCEVMGLDVVEKMTFTFTTKDGLEHAVSQLNVNIADLRRAINEAMRATEKPS